MHFLKPNCKSQFLAVKDEADRLLAKGYSKKTVYAFFIENGKIDMSYTAWLTMIRNHEREYPFKKPQKLQIPPQPQIVEAKASDTFEHNKKPYLNTPKKQEDE